MNIYKYDEIPLGLEESFECKITKEMEDDFRKITGDENPLHKDDDFAKSIGKKFNKHVSFGMLTSSFYSTLAGMYLPGENSLIHSIDIKLTNPVYCDDVLTVSGRVEQKEDTLNLICVNAKIKNQNNKIVSKAKIKIIVLK